MEPPATFRAGFDLQNLVAVNASAAFNRLAEFEVVAAGDGAAEIRMRWRDDFTQYARHLHAGMSPTFVLFPPSRAIPSRIRGERARDLSGFDQAKNVQNQVTSPRRTR